MKKMISKLLIFTIPKIVRFFSAPSRLFYPSCDNINESEYHPTFIIGAPRTGSTILYESITNRFDVIYIDNLACIFYNYLPLGIQISKFFYSNTSHNVSESKFGSTNTLGLHAPSECGEFWYRWLPRDRHFVDYNDFNASIVREIQCEIYSIIFREMKPFVFKNLNAGQRLRLIHKVSPYARFIFIKRDILETALSIYQGRINNNIKNDGWWGIMPPNVRELNRLPLYEKIVKQIYYIEKQIMDDKNLFPDSNFLTIQYEEYLDNPNNHLDIIKDFIGSDIKERNDKKALSVKKKNHTYNKKVVEGLKAEIEKIDWSFH
jgi:hypothetical protein